MPETKTTKKRTPQIHRLARFLDESVEEKEVLKTVKEALKTGRGVLVEMEIPEGLDEKSTKSKIQSKVRSSVKKHSEEKPSPFVGKGKLTVVTYPKPAEPKVIKKQVKAVSEVVEW